MMRKGIIQGVALMHYAKGCNFKIQIYCFRTNIEEK